MHNSEREPTYHLMWHRCNLISEQVEFLQGLQMAQDSGNLLQGIVSQIKLLQLADSVKKISCK